MGKHNRPAHTFGGDKTTPTGGQRGRSPLNGDNGHNNPALPGQLPLPCMTAGTVREVGGKRMFRLSISNPGGTVYGWFDEPGLVAQIEALERALVIMRTGLTIPPHGASEPLGRLLGEAQPGLLTGGDPGDY